MPATVVVGAQWGDEGKGKIVDLLAQRSDVVCRYQGGPNAGHTIIAGGETFKIRQTPSGVISGRTSVIGAGCVIDPEVLIAELDEFEGRGHSTDEVYLSGNAHLIMPWHIAIDQASERRLGNLQIGTTRRGIGPAYEDKVGRRALRVIDLADHLALPAKIDRLLAHHNALRRGVGADEIAEGDVRSALTEIAPRILPFAGSAWRRLDEARRERKRILFEGAQAVLLDIDHGTYPYVTSSNTVAGQAATGSGLGPRAIDYVLGITKAYTTRVGEGPFPSEDRNEIGDYLGQRGREFGTVTGRKRRCGWFDAVLVRQTARISGIDGIALTKLDVLDGLGEIKIAVAYRLDGREIDYFPAIEGDQARVEPVYETMEGWRDSTAGARTWNDLPAQAVKYVRHVEELIGAPIALLSTSPERDDTILVRDPFTG